MGKVSKAKTAADALHAELCSAIADLAKSVDIAVTQMRLRAQCTAAIANATKVEHAAELLRATATQSSAKKTGRVSTVPPVLDAQKSRRDKNARQTKLRSRDVPPNKAVEISMPLASGSQRLSFTTKRKTSRQKARLRCAFWSCMTVLVG
jgi:hypothetical protein